MAFQRAATREWTHLRICAPPGNDAGELDHATRISHMRREMEVNVLPQGDLGLVLHAIEGEFCNFSSFFEGFLVVGKVGLVRFQVQQYLVV